MLNDFKQLLLMVNVSIFICINFFDSKCSKKFNTFRNSRGLFNHICV